MREKVHRIDSLPADAPWQPGSAPGATGENLPLALRALDRLLAVQRPLVVAHLRGIRQHHPRATPAELVRILERRYLYTATGAGAAVGATAVVPGVGTGVGLALAGVETAGFLEATALFAQSLAEVHAVRVENPDRARALVLALMLGDEGIALVRQLSAQAGPGPTSSRPAFWGELVTKTIPKGAVSPLLDKLTKTFVTQFAGRMGGTWVGKAMPFGIGAVIGGTGNHILARRVLASSRRAFPPAPLELPAELEPRPSTLRVGAMLGTAADVSRRAGAAIGRLAGRGRRGKPDELDADTDADTAGSGADEPPPEEGARPEHPAGT